MTNRYLSPTEDSLIEKDGIRHRPIHGVDNTNDTVYEVCCCVNGTAF